MVYLRSRYYSPQSGRFLTEDSWFGDYDRPLSLNRWMYVAGNPINFTDPSGYYAQEKHFQLTYLWAQEEIMLKCPECGWMANSKLSYWVAYGSGHMDDFGLEAASHFEFHFKSYERAWSDVRRMIQTGDPVLVGAVLHGLQDYWSHTYEGYSGRWGHLWDSLRANCNLGGTSPCERTPNKMKEILLDLWDLGEIESPTTDALLKEVNQVGFYTHNLSASNLFDLWLREQDGALETRKAAAWKDKYGYDTDAYYYFTERDQSMEEDTRKAVHEYLDHIGNKGICFFYDAIYLPPLDSEIISELKGAE